MIIGIVAALREEINPLLSLLGHVARSGHPDKWPVILDFSKHQLILSACGFGKVNAAMAAQELIISHGVECLINIGTATAANKQLDIGDIVVSKKLLLHHVLSSNILLYCSIVERYKCSIIERYYDR